MASRSKDLEQFLLNSHIGKFHELTRFFDITSSFSHRTNLNVNVNKEQCSLFQSKWNLNLDSSVSMNVNDRYHRQNLTLHSSLFSSNSEPFSSAFVTVKIPDKHFLFGLRHHCSPCLSFAFRLGNVSNYRLWTNIEYQTNRESCEIVLENIWKHSSNLQMTYLSSMLRTNSYRLDVGFDFRVSQVYLLVKTRKHRSQNLDECQRKTDRWCAAFSSKV